MAKRAPATQRAPKPHVLSSQQGRRHRARSPTWKHANPTLQARTESHGAPSAPSPALDTHRGVSPWSTHHPSVPQPSPLTGSQRGSEGQRTPPVEASSAPSGRASAEGVASPEGASCGTDASTTRTSGHEASRAASRSPGGACSPQASSSKSESNNREGARCTRDSVWHISVALTSVLRTPPPLRGSH